ncbi:secretin and TonB N terminus short domain protein, partial [Burkholderia sp. Ac-20353]|nr:secretin and TonB N terminus short domain protein [Burkholderia sp. Ac-20353]
EAMIVAQPATREAAPDAPDAMLGGALPIDGIGDSDERRAYAGSGQSRRGDALWAALTG